MIWGGFVYVAVSPAVSARISSQPTPTNSVHDCARVVRSFSRIFYGLQKRVAGLKIRVSTVQFRPPAPSPKPRPTSIYVDLSLPERPPQIRSKYPNCARNCVRDKPSLSNSNQLTPKWRLKTIDVPMRVDHASRFILRSRAVRGRDLAIGVGHEFSLLEI